jgi:hypothetical protein
MARRRCSAPSAVLVRTFQISWVVLAVACLPATAWSQSAESDKSEYTLLDPVPEDKLRSFSPDRPAKSTNPYTVDAGHVQYETDFFNYTYQKTGPVRTTTWLGLNPTLKVGVTNDIDIEANIAPFENVETSDSVAGISSSISGVSDLFLRAKINLWGNDGGKTAGAIIPYLKAPTAPNGIGNGATEGGFIAPLAISLPSLLTSPTGMSGFGNSLRQESALDSKNCRTAIEGGSPLALLGFIRIRNPASAEGARARSQELSQQQHRP